MQEGSRGSSRVRSGATKQHRARDALKPCLREGRLAGIFLSFPVSTGRADSPTVRKCRALDVGRCWGGIGSF
jgi:hypothetical protein